LVLAAPLQAQVVKPLNAKASYLHTNGEPAVASVPIALAPLGIQPGDCVRLRTVGNFDYGPSGDDYGYTWGVFSADSTLLAASLLHRVPGALDAGVDLVTPTTFIGNQATDIPEDFAITVLGIDEVTLEVPAGAAFLFACAADHYFSDNSDPNANYGLELTVVGCWKDLGLGLAGLNGTPSLGGSGTLLGGDAMSLAIASGRPLSTAALVVGFSQINAPFKGGTMVPAANLLVAGLPLDGAGELTLPGTWPAGLPSGLSIFLQAWIADAAGPHGFSATNGLSATTP
jgi:hypothetical protein